MIKTDDLRLRMGERVLVDGLTWQVDAGQCWCVVGRNGAGKSTLLRALAGLHNPDRGTLTLKDKPLSAWPPLALARERAYLPQTHNDAFGYRVIETVLSARHPYHGDRYWEDSDDHRAAHAALQAMEAAHLAERDVRTLSGGERQRVAIAALLAQDAPLLLLDEPAAALDLRHQVGVMHLLQRLCREQGKAAVLVSHDLNLAHGVATHGLLMMDDGSCRLGAAAEVMQAPLLSACLGHPVDEIRQDGRTIFVPREAW
jgi:iron complex transport system ATP-binding protein